MKQKKPVKYYGVSLPLPFVEQILDHIKHDPGYHNVPEFVKQAVREKIERDTIASKAVDRYIDSPKKLNEISKEIGEFSIRVAVLNRMLEDLGFTDKKTKKNKEKD